MADKTYAQLSQATGIQPGDLMAVFSGSGPMQAITWAILLAAVQSGLNQRFPLLANNLSDLPNVGQARSNLGLGNAAVASIGQSANQVAAGNDPRFASALQLAQAALPASFITAGTAAPGTLAPGVLYFQHS